MFSWHKKNFDDCINPKVPILGLLYKTYISYNSLCNDHLTLSSFFLGGQFLELCIIVFASK
jgi:hypothetical protein